MPVPAVLYLNPKNSQVINIGFLKDIATNAFLDTAVITATLVDQYGNQDPIFNAIQVAYQVGSQGNYVGVVPGGFNPSLGSGYKLLIDANQGGVIGHWEVPVTIKARTQ